MEKVYIAFGKNEKEQESVMFWGCYQLICVYSQADPAGREVKEELWRCVSLRSQPRGTPGVESRLFSETNLNLGRKEGEWCVQRPGDMGGHPKEHMTCFCCRRSQHPWTGSEGSSTGLVGDGGARSGPQRQPRGWELDGIQAEPGPTDKDDGLQEAHKGSLVL